MKARGIVADISADLAPVRGNRPALRGSIAPGDVRSSVGARPDRIPDQRQAELTRRLLRMAERGPVIEMMIGVRGNEHDPGAERNQTAAQAACPAIC